jgi:hypothetical protein
MAEKGNQGADNRQAIAPNKSPRDAADVRFDLKRKLEAAVEGDPRRLRAIARARRNKRRPRV